MKYALKRFNAGELARLRGKKASSHPAVDYPFLCEGQFMAIHTLFPDFVSWLSDGGFPADFPRAISYLNQRRLDRYVKKSTSFSSWEEMLGAAVSSWVRKEAGSKPLLCSASTLDNREGPDTVIVE